MPKKIRLRKSDIKSIQHIVDLLTKKVKKTKRKKSSKSKPKTLKNTLQAPTQQFIDSLGPKTFASYNPTGSSNPFQGSNLFKNPFQQPVISQPTAPTQSTKETNWEDVVKKIVEAQTKAFSEKLNPKPRNVAPTPDPRVSTKRDAFPTPTKVDNYSDDEILTTNPSRFRPYSTASSSSSSTQSNPRVPLKLPSLVSSSSSSSSFKPFSSTDPFAFSSSSDFYTPNIERRVKDIEQRNTELFTNLLGGSSSDHESDLENEIENQMPPLVQQPFEAPLENVVNEIQDAQVQQIIPQLIPADAAEGKQEAKDAQPGEIVEIVKNVAQLIPNTEVKFNKFGPGFPLYAIGDTVKVKNKNTKVEHSYRIAMTVNGVLLYEDKGEWKHVTTMSEAYQQQIEDSINPNTEYPLQSALDADEDLKAEYEEYIKPKPETKPKKSRKKSKP